MKDKCPENLPLGCGNRANSPEYIVKVVCDAGEESERGEEDEGEPEVPPAGAVRQREVVEAVRRGPQAEAWKEI